MNLSVIFVLPGLVCLFWAFVHAFLAARTTSFRILFFLLLTVFFTVSGDVLLGPVLESEALADILVMASAPAVIPLTCLYFAYLNKPFAIKPL